MRWIGLVVVLAVSLPLAPLRERQQSVVGARWTSERCRRNGRLTRMLVGAIKRFDGTEGASPRLHGHVGFTGRYLATSGRS
jgi:hypothetical protein